MSQIGNTLHGINFQTADFAKDYHTGRPAHVGKGERTPFARGSAKFTSSSAVSIKLSTVGRPEARASKLTAKAIETSSRSLGEMFGAMSKGNMAGARDWLTQADSNLSPLLSPSNLGHAQELQGKGLTPQDVRNEIIGARMGKHLGAMDAGNLKKLANELSQPGVDLGPDTQRIKDAVYQEIDRRVGDSLGALRQDLAAHARDPAWMQGKLNMQTAQLAELRIAGGKVGDCAVDPNGLAGKIRAQLLLELPGREARAAVANLDVQTLMDVVKHAREPLLGEARNELVPHFERARELFADAMVKYEADPREATLMEGLKHWETLHDVTGVIDKTMQGANSRDIAKMNLEVLYGTLANHPEALGNLSTAKLEKLMSLGQHEGMDLHTAGGNQSRSVDAREFRAEVSVVARQRAEVAYERLQEKDLKANLHAFKTECAELYQNLRLADRMLPEEMSEVYLSKLFNHMHFDAPTASGAEAVATFLRGVGA